MKELILVLLIHTPVYGRLCSNAKEEHTQGVENTDSHIKENSVKYVTVRYGHYIDLECCSAGDSGVSWMKWSNDENKWQQYLPDRTEVLFYDNKQILAIESSTYEDTGLYKCSIQNSTSGTDVTKFHVAVVACDKLSRGPYPTSPLPCRETVARESTTFTLPCTGYFGCHEEGDIRIVTWFVSLDKNKKDDWLEASSVDKRYWQTGFQRDNRAVKGSNLTITEVSAVDFNRKFMCLLATPQTVEGQTRLVVTLKSDQTSPLFTSSVSSVGILAGIITVTVLSLVVNIVITVRIVYGKSRKGRGKLEQNSVQKWMPVTLSDNV